MCLVTVSSPDRLILSRSNSRAAAEVSTGSRDFKRGQYPVAGRMPGGPRLPRARRPPERAGLARSAASAAALERELSPAAHQRKALLVFPSVSSVSGSSHFCPLCIPETDQRAEYPGRQKSGRQRSASAHCEPAAGGRAVAFRAAPVCESFCRSSMCRVESGRRRAGECPGAGKGAGWYAIVK